MGRLVPGWGGAWTGPRGREGGNEWGRLAGHQDQGDPAYLGVVPGPWPRPGLSGSRRDKQEPLSGKGGQVGAWVRAPRAVSALPPADLRQSRSGWGEGRGPAGGTRRGSQPLMGPLARRGNGGGLRMWRRAGPLCSAALGTPALQVEGGLGHTHRHPGFQGPRQVPCASCSQRGRRSDVRSGSPWQGAMEAPTFRVPCSAWHPDSPVLVGPTLVSKHLRVGKGLRPLPAPSSPPRKAAQAQLRGRRQRGGCRGEGHRGGMWEAGRGDSRGLQGCQEVFCAGH